MTRSRSVLRIVCLLTLVVVGCIVWIALRSEPTRESVAPKQASNTPESSRLDPAAVGVASRESAAAANPPSTVAVKPAAAPLILAGRVLAKEDSAPVAGAVVKLLVEQGWQWFDTMTDAAGAFHFELEQPSTVRTVRIHATPNTTALDAYGQDAFPPGTTLERTFFVTRGASLSGTVVDLSGAPVVGAEVFGWCTPNYPNDSPPDRTTTSDGNGRFMLSNLGESFFAAARASDRCCMRGLRGNLVPGTHAEGLEVVVAPCVSVRGHVVDDLDHELAGATLSMAGAHSSSSEDNTPVPGVTRCYWASAAVTCDANGAFEITGLPGPSFIRSAWCEHETCIGDHVRMDSSIADNRVVLKRGVEVTGIVRRSNGQPAAKASVIFGHTGGRIAKSTTAENGTFTVRGLPVEVELILRVRLPGEAIYSSNISTASGTPPLEIRLEPARSLAGIVLDESNAVIPFAKVRIEGDRLVTYSDVSFGEPTTWEFSHDMNHTIADAEGRFRFDDLYDGTFEICATDPAGVVGSGKIVSPSGIEDIVVRFDSSLTTAFVGRVVDDSTGDPIREFTLTCMKPEKGGGGSWNGSAKRFSAADGSFRYGGIEAGSAELSVNAVGYARLSFGAHEYTAGPHELEARMFPVRTLGLEFVRSDGRPFEGGEVSATDSDGRKLQLNTGLGSTSSRVHVNARSIQLAGLPARPITIHVHADGESFDYDFDLRTPIETTQKVVLKTVSKIDVTVIFFDTQGKTSSTEPPKFLQEEAELILEDAKGQHVATIHVKPSPKGYDITCRTSRSGSQMTGEQSVAHTNVRSTVATGKLRVGGRAPVQLAVPSPGKDGRIEWYIDVSKL